MSAFRAFSPGARVGSRWVPEVLPRGPFPMPRSRACRRYSRPTPRDRVRGGVDVRPMIPLGQFRDTFIIAIDDEGMAIIDQHVAHERVLFERVMERLTPGGSRASGCWRRW